MIFITSESPYAEFMGDINNPFCAGTGEWVEGCIYNCHANPYLPDV
jgi:beta-glucosidase